MTSAPLVLLRRVRGTIVNLLSLIVGGALTALVSLDTVTVVLRYRFGGGFDWTSDVEILLLMTMTWLAVPLIWLTSGHIALDALGPRASPLLRRRFQRVMDLLFLAAMAALLIAGFQAMRIYALMDMPVLPVSQAVKFMPMVAAALVGLAVAILRLCLPPSLSAHTGERAP